MVVMAKDKYGVAANATVAIRISRKPTDIAPFFEKEPYHADILVTHAVNSPILAVSATDHDLKVCGDFLYSKVILQTAIFYFCK